MAQTIKLPDDLMQVLREEAESQDRSIAGQVRHWIRLGQALEASLPYERMRAALTGKLDTRKLSDEQLDHWNKGIFALLTGEGETPEAIAEQIADDAK